MSEPTDSAQTPHSDQSARTPQETADQQQATRTETQGEIDVKGVMAHLDIPADIQANLVAQIEGPPEPPKAEAQVAEPEPETQQAQPEPEQPEPEEPEPDADGTREPPTDEHGKIDKSVFDKRVGRFTRQKKQLETQLDQFAVENQRLQQELAKVQGGKAEAPTYAGGKLMAIENEIEKTDAFIAWCDKNAQGATLNEGTDKEQFVDGETMTEWRRNAIGARMEQVVARNQEREKVQVDKTQFDQLTASLWPEIFDPKTKEYQEAQSLLQQFPMLKSHPRVNYAIGLTIEGDRALRARAKNGQKKPHKDIDERVFSQPRVPIAPHAPEPPSRESVAQLPQRKFNDAMSELVKNPDGSTEALAAALNALDEAEGTRPNSRSQVKV